MEFKEAMRVFRRICKDREMCEGCVLEDKCIVLTECDYAEAEAILAKWAAERPEKTIMDDFLERCPNATKDDMETPYACAKHCGYHAPTYCERLPQRCAECWRRPLEEVE